jgi:hypothetical protein
VVELETVELEPQEDAMPLSLVLMSVDGARPAPFHLPEHISRGCAQFLLCAAFGVLVASPPFLRAQSADPPESSNSVSSKTGICEEHKQDSQQQLSLAAIKSKSSDQEMSTAGGQSSSQDSTELMNKDRSLPELQHSSSAAQQEPLCTKTRSGAEPEPSAGPSSESQPATVPVESPDVPTVSYADGNLTVNARNARMGDVIEAIRVRTGISVEFPPEGMGARVFDHVGPAPLRVVLMELLYGSGFNYIISTSSKDPQTVTRLILSAQAHGVSTGATQQASQPVAEQAEGPSAYGAAGFRNETPTEDAVQPIPAAPISAPSSVTGVPAGFNVQQAAAAAQKTPGQILDELQKRQLQMLDDQTPPPQP